MDNTIFNFSTARFRVVVSVEPEFDLDLSWDEDGEVARKLDNGVYVAFCVKTAIYLDDKEIASDYLGECIYESFSDFRKNSGYFIDGVRECIRHARAYLNEAPKLRVH